MNIHSQKFYLDGDAGKMQCLLDLPDDAPRGIALVAHPHPLYGGTMENKVAQTLARTFVTLGYAVARFNFRGVGESEGVYDDGKGEVDDMAIMYEHMRARYPDLPVTLAGFSFGTFVQAQFALRLEAEGRAPERLVLVGT
ncbi:alpha/beta hydrolase, partial [Acinetobacter seifertii]